MAMFCDVLEPTTGQYYERDPRGIAKKRRSLHEVRRAWATRVVFGPEAEFFIFDDVKFNADPYNTGFKLDCAELPSNIGHRLRDGQPRPPSAHQGRLLPRAAGRQLPGHPLRDAVGDGRDGRRRSRSTTTRSPPPSTSSASSSARWSRIADHMQIYKYVDPHGRRRPTARRPASCPSPIFGDNGSGMHVPPVDLEGLRRRCSPATSTPTCRRPA